MELINEIFESELVKVNDAFPSIYTKDDVQRLLLDLQSRVAAVKLEPVVVDRINTDNFVDTVTRHLHARFGDFDLVDPDAIEFELDYNNRISVTSADVDYTTLEALVCDAVNTAIYETMQENLNKE